MKILFAFLFLVAICQADIHERDEDAFRFLSNMDLNQMARNVEDEVNNMLKENFTPEEIEWMSVLANDFADRLRQEAEEAVMMVMQSGHLNHQFTTRLFENLRKAADNISRGMNMTHIMMDSFLEETTNGLDALEESGLLEIDLEPLFEGLTESALTVFEEEARKKRDIGGLLDRMNDTLHRVIGRMNGQYRDLHEFFVQHMRSSRDTTEPQIENLKILARNFITNIKSAQRSVLEHAIEFFSPYAQELGDVYVQLIEKTNARLNKMNATPIPAIYK